MKKWFYVDAPPPRRPLKIFAFDPMLGRAASKRISIEIANEQDLKVGPHGSRVEVMDYDRTNGCYYAPVNLNDPSILMRGRLDPNESDPQFHQQMVYVVAMKVLENFEQALGRRIAFRYNQGLRIFPRARIPPPRQASPTSRRSGRAVSVSPVVDLLHEGLKNGTRLTPLGWRSYQISDEN